VTGAGGVTRYAATPLVQYRQHEANVVGANNTWRARLMRLKALFHGQFARWNETNIEGLGKNRDLLTDDAKATLDAFSEARRGGPLQAVASLRRSGVYRQTVGGTLLLWGAITLGLM